MPAEGITLYEVSPLDGLMVSILVLFLGLYLTRKIAFLRNFYIPPAVSGGLLCSIVIAVIYFAADLQVTFDLQIRDVLLLVFFSTIGLSAKLGTLVSGGRALAVLVLVAAVFLFVQDVTGIGLALLLGSPRSPGAPRRRRRACRVPARWASPLRPSA